MVPAAAIAVANFILPPPGNVPVAGWHLAGLLVPLIAIWATEAMPVGEAQVLAFLGLVSAAGNEAVILAYQKARSI